MKKIVKLTESDLTRIVRRVIREGAEAEHIYSAEEFIKMFPNIKGTFEVVNGGNIRMNYKNEEGKDTYLEIR